MTRTIVGAWRRCWLAAALAGLSSAVQAQDAALAACACRADSGVVWAEVEMTAKNVAVLRRALPGSNPILEGQVLTISNRCPDPGHCADRDWQPVGAGSLRLKVTGHLSSPGLFEDRRLRVEALNADATLTLMGQSP